MKKSLLSLAFVAMGIAAFAQKPAAGNITTEIGLSSLLGTPANPATANIPVGMFRVRYFLSSDMAVRAHLGFGMATTTTQISTTPPAAALTAERKASTTSFGLAVGIEKHLAGTDKLSPYIGAEVGFGMASGTVDITNSNVAAGTPTASGDAYNSSGGGTTNIALNGLVGADYYITDKVYIGAEMGIGLFGIASTSDMEVKTTTAATSTTTTVTAPGGSSTSFGLQPGVLGLVRVGLILF